jgi:hypothetical protein
MKTAAIHPRPDQIAELTRGLHLPLPEISSVHLEVIAEGIFQAFRDIRAQSPSTVVLGTEAEVTALMESCLNKMIEQDPLWRELVLCVARGKESLSFDGSHLEKRPDLSIYLSNRNRGFPLIAEAKIMDAAASKTEALYCDHGINRFVEGDYAWESREAFMLAYVRDGSSIDTKLTPLLSRAMLQKPPAYLVEGLPVAIGTGSTDLACSRHGRRFVYSGSTSSSSEPGLISVWHLWLS